MLLAFGPPASGSGSISQRHGSGSFYYPADLVRKNLIPTVLLLLIDFLSLQNDVNVGYIQKVISRKPTPFPVLLYLQAFTSSRISFPIFLSKFSFLPYIFIPSLIISA
jgi:hypothetical protein